MYALTPTIHCLKILPWVNSCRDTQKDGQELQCDIVFHNKPVSANIYACSLSASRPPSVLCLLMLLKLTTISPLHFTYEETGAQGHIANRKQSLDLSWTMEPWNQFLGIVPYIQSLRCLSSINLVFHHMKDCALP
jgi:hypothetical protein